MDYTGHLLNLLILLSISLAAKKNLLHAATTSPRVTTETLNLKIHNFDYIKNFTKSSIEPHILAFELLKPVPQFYIDSFIKGRHGSAFSYNISNINGCLVLKSISNNKVFSQIYQQILVDGSSNFECPLMPKVYYLRDVISYGSASYFGRNGYNLTIQIKLDQSSLPICAFQRKYIVRS